MTGTANTFCKNFAHILYSFTENCAHILYTFTEIENQFVKYDPFDFFPQLFLDNNDLNAGLYEGEVKKK